jgi:SpoVK/Ycf46/Vps4 family AAA+-type ATPase
VKEDRPGFLPLPSTRYLDCLRRVGELCGLSELDHQILAWAYLMRVEDGLRFPSSGLAGFRRLELSDLLGHILGAEPGTVEAALLPDSPLVRSGLIKANRAGEWSEWIDPPDYLVQALYLPPENPLEVFRGALDPCLPGSLERADFPHLDDHLGTLLTYLQAVRATGKPGVNILLYGPPGTGKTELSQVLAKASGGKLYEVALTGRDGNPKKAMDRMQTFATAQMILRRSPEAVLLFDEMESSFAASGEDKDDTLRGLKGWLNRSLETNPVPTFWITNFVQVLDEAFIRRFDLCLEVGIPPRNVRRKILEHHLGDLPVEEAVRERLAARDNLAPAVVARSAQVARTIWEATPEKSVGEILTQLMEGTVKALGGRRFPKGASAQDLPYRLDVLQTDVNLPEVLQGLASSAQGRFCLYGPPGTGKTAFGRYLAETLNRPLLVKRASDLQSKWVGETEQNMARMFYQASSEGAVLLLDEADSFLRGRQEANHSWEVSQVNEMLTQMEAFEGIFIASTNLMGSLDEASLRRFDLKIRFGFLKSAQAWALFQEAAKGLGLEAPASLEAALCHLSYLTPGDFATVLRQSRLSRITDAKDLLDRLRKEVDAKPQRRHKAVGF